MRAGIGAVVVGSALVLLPGLPSEAWAQAPPAAAQLGDPHEAARGFAAQAVKLYDTGEYPLALELFQKADALYPEPAFRVYVARTYAKLGKLKRSLAMYDAALQMPPPPNPPPSFVEAQKTAAEERPDVAKRLPVLRIDVTGARAQDVTLTVDKDPVSPASWQRLALDPGPHEIVATAPGTLGRSLTVELREGASSSVLVTLEHPKPPPPRPPWRPLAIAGGALAGAGLVAVIASTAVLAETRGTILTDCPNRLCNAKGWSLIHSVGPTNAVNLAGWIATAAGGAATIVFVTLDARGSKPTTEVIPAPLPGGAGVWMTRRF